MYWMCETGYAEHPGLHDHFHVATGSIARIYSPATPPASYFGNRPPSAGLLLRVRTILRVFRFAEAASWAAARWADTYLLPDSVDGSSPGMTHAFGHGSPSADQALGTLVRVATAALTKPEWAGEVDLHCVAVLRLLPALVRRPRAAARLVALPQWQQLAGGLLLHAQIQPQLVTIPPHGHRLDDSCIDSACDSRLPPGLTMQHFHSPIAPRCMACSDDRDACAALSAGLASGHLILTG